MYPTPITYFARVEFHNASPENYRDLQSKMAAIRFVKKYKAESGMIVELPTAEYINTHSTQTNIKMVQAEITRIAKSIDPDCEILVIHVLRMMMTTGRVDHTQGR